MSPAKIYKNNGVYLKDNLRQLKRQLMTIRG